MIRTLLRRRLGETSRVPRVQWWMGSISEEKLGKEKP
jgi:hypothetical protein